MLKKKKNKKNLQTCKAWSLKIILSTYSQIFPAKGFVYCEAPVCCCWYWDLPRLHEVTAFINSFISYLQCLAVPDLLSSATQGSPHALLWVTVPVVQRGRAERCWARSESQKLLQETSESSPRRLGVGSIHGAAPAASSGLGTLRGVPYTRTTATPSSWGPGHARPQGLPLCNPKTSLKLALTYGRARRSSSCHPPKSDELR